MIDFFEKIQRIYVKYDLELDKKGYIINSNLLMEKVVSDVNQVKRITRMGKNALKKCLKIFHNNINYLVNKQ